VALVNASVHHDCTRSCRAEIDQQRLLTILVEEFGGEVTCVDLTSMMQSLPDFKHVDARCIHCIRDLLADLCRLGLVTLEAMGKDKLIVRISSKGAACGSFEKS